MLYEEIARQFTAGRVLNLPPNRINKAYIGLSSPEFFNVGMRNRLTTSNTESYRIYAGPKAQKAIKVSDGRLYHPGHSFGRATEGDQEVTIGLSSSSKIWSNASSRIPELLEWCEALAKKLCSDEEVVTHSELDRLRPAERVTKIPEGVIAADWPKDIYLTPPIARYWDSTGRQHRRSLLDFDLVVDPSLSDENRVRLVVCGHGIEYPLDFSLNADRYFTPPFPGADGERSPARILVEGRMFGQVNSLLDYINARPVEFYFADFSVLMGHSCSRPFPTELVAFDPAQIEVVDWDGEGVDIQIEYGSTQAGRASIHEQVKRYLLAGDYDVVFYDHGSGEIADYLAIRSESKMVQFDLYHCKGSKGARPGDGVGDVYEVCGQVVKSLRWVENNNRILAHVQRRSRLSSVFVRGDLPTLEEIVQGARTKQSIYQIVAVQPAISRANLSPKLADILAGANDCIIQGGSEALGVLGSA